MMTADTHPVNRMTTFNSLFPDLLDEVNKDYAIEHLFDFPIYCGAGLQSSRIVSGSDWSIELMCNDEDEDDSPLFRSEFTGRGEQIMTKSFSTPIEALVSLSRLLYPEIGTNQTFLKRSAALLEENEQRRSS